MIAQRHADQCKFAHDCSECRQVDRFSVGQNLFIMKQSVRPAPADWQRVVGKWYGEVASFGRDQVFSIAVREGDWTPSDLFSHEVILIVFCSW